MNRENLTSREETRADIPTGSSEIVGKIIDIIGEVITEGAPTGAVKSNDVKVFEGIVKVLENPEGKEIE